MEESREEPGSIRTEDADRKLASWEAVVPGVVFPLLALWLGGSTWPARGLAAAYNLAPLAALAAVAWLGGRHTAAVQGAATISYGLLALAWAAETWDLAALSTLGAEAGRFSPVVAAVVGILIFLVVALVSKWTGESNSSAVEAS